MDVLRLSAIYLLCSCYMWTLGSVYVLQSDMVDVADGVSLRGVRNDQGSHTDGPGIYLSLWAPVMHDAPAPDRRCCSAKLDSEAGWAGIPISSVPAFQL